MLDPLLKEAAADQATEGASLSILDLLINGGTAGMLFISILNDFLQ